MPIGKRAAETSPMSVFANTGQDCCARSRVFVEKPIFDKFVELFVASTRKLVTGDPTKPETQLGPVASATQRKTIEEFIADARTSATSFGCGGERLKEKGSISSPRS